MFRRIKYNGINLMPIQLLQNINESENTNKNDYI